jgi:hypothetical protein
MFGLDEHSKRGKLGFEFGHVSITLPAQRLKPFLERGEDLSYFLLNKLARSCKSLRMSRMTRTLARLGEQAKSLAPQMRQGVKRA